MSTPTSIVAEFSVHEGPLGPNWVENTSIRTVGESAKLLGIEPNSHYDHCVLTLDYYDVEITDEEGNTEVKRKSKACRYALRDVLEMDIRSHDGMYIAPGRFPLGSIRGSGGARQSLAGIEFIPLDADLKDYLKDELKVETVGEAAEIIHQMTDAELARHLRALQGDFEEVLRTLGIPIHRMVVTGYGIQAWVKIREEDQHRVDDFAYVPRNLVAAINHLFGGDVVDSSASDPGSRQARLPGSENRKNLNKPREARMVFSSDEEPPARLDDLRAIVPLPSRSRSVKKRAFNEFLSEAQVDEIVERVSTEYREGRRQDIVLGLSGMLAKAGIDESLAEVLIDTIAEKCGDEEADDRLKVVSRTYQKLLAGRVVSGYWWLKTRLTEPLLQYLSETLPAIEGSDSQGSSPRQGEYVATSAGMVHLRPGNGGVARVPLSNFTARIVEDLTIDDGRDKTREFVIEGELGGKRLPRVRIPAREFGAMNWVTDSWGARAVIYAGFATASGVRTAIQMLSESCLERVERQHSGWITLEEHGPLYLHTGGAIGANGPVDGVEVQLPRSATRLALPRLPADEEVHRAIQSSLQLMELAPDEVMAPVLATAYRAPLAGMLAPDLGVFLVGPSGSQKSELAALLMQHFGSSFNRTELPAQWSSTGNALERVAFDYKDAPCVIDDFNPTGTPSQVAAMHRTAEQVFRAAGNRNGRSRMQANLAFRESFPPRGLVVGTGEDLPDGLSLKARLFIVELARGDVIIPELTACQERARSGVYAIATAAYVQWLAANYETVAAELKEQFAEYRSRAKLDGSHARTPETVAHLALGWSIFLDFAVARGAVTDEEAQVLFQRAWDALERGGRRQIEHQEAEQPADQFVEGLRSALSSGVGHLAPRVAGEHAFDQEVLAAMGWWDSYPNGACLGWFEGNDIYIDAKSALKAISGLTNLPLREKTVSKRLKQAGFIKSTPPDGRSVGIQIQAGGARRRALHMDISVLGIDSASPLPPDGSKWQGVRAWQPSVASEDRMLSEPLKQFVTYASAQTAPSP